MNKRPLRESGSKTVPLKRTVTGRLGHLEAKAPAGGVVLQTQNHNKHDIVVIGIDGKKYRFDSRKNFVNKVGRIENKRIGYKKVIIDRSMTIGTSVNQNFVGSQADFYSKTDDPRMTVLSGKAYDALAQELDNPSAPSNKAKEAIARSRLWRK